MRTPLADVPIDLSNLPYPVALAVPLSLLAVILSSVVGGPGRFGLYRYKKLAWRPDESHLTGHGVAHIQLIQTGVIVWAGALVLEAALQSGGLILVAGMVGAVLTCVRVRSCVAAKTEETSPSFSSWPGMPRMLPFDLVVFGVPLLLIIILI